MSDPTYGLAAVRTLAIASGAALLLTACNGDATTAGAVAPAPASTGSTSATGSGSTSGSVTPATGAASAPTAPAAPTTSTAQASAPAGTTAPTSSGSTSTTPVQSPAATPAPVVTPVTSLPALPALNNVRLAMNGGSATISFDTVDQARDYRVYVLPADGNIRAASDGTVIVPNSIYRCAGTYQVPTANREDEVQQSNGITARVASQVNGFTRTLADATLGYVYTTPGSGLVPVYAVGAPDVRADGDYFYRFQASRDKVLTTSASEYASLVATGWRDDGIVFYVPSQASASTKPIATNVAVNDTNNGTRYYLNQGAELTSRSASQSFKTAFNVLASQSPGSQPLMRVMYQAFGGRSHDELAVGAANFNRIRYQGLSNPVPSVHFSGISQTTTLVVEALDRGCPHQAVVAAASKAAESLTFGSYTVAHQPWSTIADLQRSVPDGEVFVNGQFDGVAGRPKAIARAFVNVVPDVRPTMDWMSTAASFSEPFTPLSCQSPVGNCTQEFYLQSNTYAASFFWTETGRYTLGNVQGQLLVNYSDWAADTNGKFRMTVRNQRATISANTFVHATMEVNSVGSGRRYPQLMLSDQGVPVQYNLERGRTLILQTFGDFPSRVDLEICDHRTWDVNNQCPRFILRHRFDGSGAISGLNPLPEEDAFMAAVDAPTRFDLYASNARAYIFVNDKPYGCANLGGASGVSPLPVAPTGPVTVTFGDVLYHSDADDNFRYKMVGGYINRHQMNSTSRHFDNLGFSSGVPAPVWDEARFPCSSTLTDLNYDPGPAL